MHGSSRKPYTLSLMARIGQEEEAVGTQQTLHSKCPCGKPGTALFHDNSSADADRTPSQPMHDALTKLLSKAHGHAEGTACAPSWPDESVNLLAAASSSDVPAAWHSAALSVRGGSAADLHAPQLEVASLQGTSASHMPGRSRAPKPQRRRTSRGLRWPPHRSWLPHSSRPPAPS